MSIESDMRLEDLEERLLRIEEVTGTMLAAIAYALAPDGRADTGTVIADIENLQRFYPRVL